MKRAFSVQLPTALVAYCRKEGGDPATVANLLLEEHGRECATMLLEEKNGRRELRGMTPAVMERC